MRGFSRGMVQGPSRRQSNRRRNSAPVVKQPVHNKTRVSDHLNPIREIRWRASQLGTPKVARQELSPVGVADLERFWTLRKKTVDQPQKGRKAASNKSGASPLIRQYAQPHRVAMSLLAWTGLLLRADSRNRIGGQSCATSFRRPRQPIIGGRHQTGAMSLQGCTCHALSGLV